MKMKIASLAETVTTETGSGKIDVMCEQGWHLWQPVRWQVPVGTGALVKQSDSEKQ